MSRIDLPKYQLSNELFKETLVQIIDESFTSFRSASVSNPSVNIRNYLSDDGQHACLEIEFFSLGDDSFDYRHKDMPVIKDKINNFFTKYIDENNEYTLDEFNRPFIFTLLLKVDLKK